MSELTGADAHGASFTFSTSPCRRTERCDKPVRQQGQRDHRHADEGERAALFETGSHVGYVRGSVMRSVYEQRVSEAREIEGHIASGRDRIVPPPKFGDVCRLLWPDKTAAHIAAIGNRDERTAKRWLSGEYDPPIQVVLAVMHRMFERGE